MNRTPVIHLVTLAPRQVELIQVGLRLIPAHLAETKEYSASLKGLLHKLDHCEVFGYPCQNLATDNSLIRAGYAAGYRAARAAMPPREPTFGMVSRGARTCWDKGGEITVSNVWRAMHDAWTQEQTSGKAMPATGLSSPDHAGTASPLDHQSSAEPRVPVRVPCPNKVDGVCPLPNVHCAYPKCTEGTAPLSHVTPAKPPAQAVTDGPAADPIADLCAELRATHCSNENLHDNAAYELERLARERDDVRAMLQNTNRDAARLASLVDKYKWQVRDTCTRAERAEAERDTLRAIVRAADAIRTGADCPRCDSGKLRNPEKEHWESCGFGQYDRARAAWKGEV